VVITTGEPLEEEMLVKYVMGRWPAAKVWFHVRLGKLPNLEIPGLDPERARRLAMPAMPEIDCIVVDDADIYMIEAKVVRVWENLGKMMLYRNLLPNTPGWENVDLTKVKMLMVVARAPPELIAAATAQGIDVAQYTTPRIEEWFRSH